MPFLTHSSAQPELFPHLLTQEIVTPGTAEGRGLFQPGKAGVHQHPWMEPAVGLASNTDPSVCNNRPIFLLWMNKKAGLFV